MMEFNINTVIFLMEKEIIIKEFKVLVHFNGPKRKKTDVTVKCTLLCTHPPVVLF